MIITLDERNFHNDAIMIIMMINYKSYTNTQSENHLKARIGTITIAIT